MNTPKTNVLTIRTHTIRFMLAGLLLSMATAVSYAQSPFAIDGTVPDAGCCYEFDDPVGSISELGPVNSSVTKLGSINTATVPMLGFTNPNGATDIGKIWLDTGKDADGDIWLYFAWERDSSSGSSVISYEFQAASSDPACDYSAIDQVQPEDPAETALINACNPWGNRQAGDFLIVWDFGGGKTDIVLRTFDGNGFDAGTNLSASGFAEASLSGDSSRGEGAINLTEAIFDRAQTCLVYDNILPGTITGNSDTADYKDTVLAEISSVITISNCGVVNITKSTDPVGEMGNFAYTLQRSGGGDIDFTPRSSAMGVLVDDGGSDQLLVLPGSDYQLTEDLTAEPGFELQSILCNRPAADTDGTAAFTIDEGNSTNCVITNELLTGTITVVKEVINGYGGTAVPGDFCLSLNDDENTPAFAGNDLGTLFTFAIGNQYDVSEVACGNPDTSPQGYMASYAGDCTDTITARTDKLCTVTNTQQPQPQGDFALYKNVINDNGGGSPASAWTLSASLKAGSPGTCTSSGIAGADSGGGVSGSLSVSNAFATCVYELAESTGPAGYAMEGWSCEGDVSLNSAEITVGPGGGSCTVTNNDIPPSLTLVKQVVNDHGGTEQAGAWTLSAAGPTPISGAGSASSDAMFSAGTYTMSEAGPGGYLASGWGCEGGSQSGDSITLAIGESATCVIENNDIQPILTLVKTVINDNGGMLTVGGFPLYVDDLQVVSGESKYLTAGSFMVSEANQPGYEAGAWGGDCAADGSIDLQVGDNKTCTITNNDIPPELKIVKTAVEPFAQPGDTLHYSITVTNIGGGDALQVSLTDPLPPAANPEESLAPLPWTTGTAGCSVSGDGTMLSCDIGTLALDPTPDMVESGDEASFTVNLTAVVPDDYLDGSPEAPGGPGSLGSYFEIDGNLVADSGTAALDWGSAGLSVLNVLDPPLTDLSPEYGTDNAFTDGAKEDDVNPTVLDASVPPNKSDLTNFLIAQDEVNGNGFLALAWIRANSLGTANFDFELNQSTQIEPNGVTLQRTDHDVLISFDFESSGNVVLLTLREWDANQERWVNARALNIEGTGFAATNDSERFDTVLNGELNPFVNELLPDQTFGEALINLTQTFKGDCRKFVSAYVKGRSSTPFTAALKDFIAPYPVEINTCRTIDMLNEATADATNPGQDPVSDSAIVVLSNDPELTGDPDGDGLPNYTDPDDDGDGVNDEVDAYPMDPSEWADSDGDGVGDNADAFPDDATETRDHDGDGIGDNADTDDDNDGIDDATEMDWGTDPLNPDTDGDGVNDGSDAFPKNAAESADSDGDGVGDNGDAFPDDPSESADSDGDGVGDNADMYPADATRSQDFVDLDGMVDISGDAMADLVALSVNNASPYLTTYSGGDTGTTELSHFTIFNSNWDVLAAAVVQDGNRDGVPNDPAVAALAQSNVTGQIKVQVRDASSGALITNVTFLNSDWTAIGLAVVDDANSDGVTDDPALAVIARKNDLSRNVLSLRSLSDGAVLNNWSIHQPSWTVAGVIGLKQADGQAMLATIGTDPATGTSRIEYRRISDGAKSGTYAFGVEATVMDIVAVADGNDDGISDDPAVGVLAINANGAGIMRLRDITSGDMMKEFMMVGADWHARKSATMDDISANGIDEIMSLANGAGGQALIKIRDRASTDTLMNLWP